VVSDRTLKKIAKKGGKTVAESEIVVSEDGKKVTERQTLYFMAARPIENDDSFLPGIGGITGCSPHLRHMAGDRQ
jgi:hypothetical protein